MARQNEYDRRGAGVRDLVRAGLAAAGVILLLVASVGLVWIVGRSSSQPPALAIQGQAPPTPTPRTLSFVQKTPTVAAAPAAAPTATSTAVTVDVAEDPIAPAGTAALPLASAERETPAGGENADATRFEAPAEVEFRTLASGSWTTTENSLVNAGSSAMAEPWLTLTSVADPAFVVEAEIRVNGLLASVCDQSFGLVGGSPDAGAMFGAGLLFPCGSEAPRARLTDVAIWEDGYNADPLVAEEPFDPGEDWHTYRFEVRGDQLRFIVDGTEVVSGAPDPVADFMSTDAEAGLWAQGVDLEVRKVSVQPLPPG